MGRAERPDMAGRTARSAARSATRLRLFGRGRSRAGDGYVQLERRAFSPVLRKTELPADTRIRLDDLGNPVTYQLAADGPAGVGSASTLPRCAYQAATPMYGDHGMGVDRPSCTIAAFAPGR